MTFFFCIHWIPIEEPYQIEGKKYLHCFIYKTGFSLLDSDIDSSNLNLLTSLLVPDDNSILANSIRNNLKQKELFAVPFTDLEFLLNFDKKGNSAFRVKNTSQVKKITENQRSAWEIAFKVLNQKRKKSDIPDPRCYLHELEIESLREIMNNSSQGNPPKPEASQNYQCLSKSTKIQIGIGIGFLVLFLILIISFLVVSKKKTTKKTKS